MICIVAASALGAVVMVDRALFRGADGTKILAAGVLMDVVELRDGDRAAVASVKSPIDGYVTLVALAPQRRQHVFPEFGGADISVSAGESSEWVRLPSYATHVVFAVTETPSGEPIRRFLEDSSSKRYLPEETDSLREDLTEYLKSKGYRRIAIGMSTVPPVSGQ